MLSGQSHALSRCEHGLPWVGRSPEQTVWQCATLGGASKNHVLGRVLLHHGQAKEGGAAIQGVAQVQCDRLPPTPGRSLLVEPSGVSCERTAWWQPLSPLPPHQDHRLSVRENSVVVVMGWKKGWESFFCFGFRLIWWRKWRVGPRT